MIYVCEYDNAPPWTVIEREAKRFGLSGDRDESDEYAENHLTEPRQEPQEPEAVRLTQRRARLRERVMARRLLEYALRREYGLHSLDELAWQTGRDGKPYSAAHPEIYFNISHCGTACACVTADHEVGIDVERRFAFRPALARRVCTEQERLFMERLPEAEQERLLQVLWSMKESYVKRDGRGLAYGLGRIVLAAELEELRGLWSVRENCAKQGAQEPAYTAVPVAEDLRQGRAGDFVVRVTPQYTLAVCGVQGDAAAIRGIL